MQLGDSTFMCCYQYILHSHILYRPFQLPLLAKFVYMYADVLIPFRDRWFGFANAGMKRC